MSKFHSDSLLANPGFMDLIRKKREREQEEKERQKREAKERQEREAKDEKIEAYKLNEISKLFNLLAQSKDIDDLEVQDISFNGKTYSIIKEKNRVVIKCSDGRSFEAEMYFRSWEENDGYFSSSTVSISIANFSYTFPNNDVLSFSNEVGPYSSYDFFEKLNADKLEDQLKFRYQSHVDGYWIVPSWDFKQFCGYNRSFDFTPEGIEYSRDYLVSSDGKRLLSIKGEKVLPLEEIKDFNAADEKKKIDNLLGVDSTLHPYTKKALSDAFEQLKEVWDYVKGLLEFYKEDIPLCKSIVSARENIIDGIQHSTFSKDELLFLIDVLTQAIADKKEEKRKKEEANNSPDERAKRLIKNLSEEEKEALRRRLNNQDKMF